MTRQQLVEQIFKKRSYLCVGLDTDIDKIPKHLLSLPDPVFEFNKQIIDATKDLCVSYKINTAFYEALGVKGWMSLEKTVNYIPKEHFKIADAKRGDIGNTSAQYAKAFFETLPFDAITVAPYMGEDSVKPFLEYEGKWAIVLGLTSNKGANDFELQRVDENTTYGFMYEKILEKVSLWGTTDNLMFVIGATQSDEFTNIRKIIPNHFCLIPGVGAQGGSLKEISEKAMNKDCGILVSISRAIIFASGKEDFAEEARTTANNYQNEMKQYLMEQYNLKAGCVYEIFNTSRGLVALMDFSDNFIPKIGTVLENKSGKRWKIVGYGMGRPIKMTNLKITPHFNGFIIDCLLAPVDHSEVLNQNEILLCK